MQFKTTSGSTYTFDTQNGLTGELTSTNPKYPGPYDVQVIHPIHGGGVQVGLSAYFAFTSERNREGKIKPLLITSRVVEVTP